MNFYALTNGILGSVFIVAAIITNLPMLYGAAIIPLLVSVFSLFALRPR